MPWLARLPSARGSVKGRGMQSNRRPDWSRWNHVPEVKLWEGVALSLDIDPARVEHSRHSWMEDNYLFKERTEFQQRLDLTSRNLSSDYYSTKPLRPTSIARGDVSDCEVSLPIFAAWADSVGWVVPEEFKQLADNVPVLHGFEFDSDSPTYPEELDAALIAWRAVSRKPDSNRSPKE